MEKQPKKKLPLFQLVIDDNDELEGINCISLVSEPAIEVGWVAMSKEPKEIKFEVSDKEKRVILGPVLIPGKPIFRKDFTVDGDADVFFSAEDVEKIVQKFFRQKNESNVDLEHTLQIDGAVLYQSFISDKENGIDPSQFKDLPDKTFYVAYKIYDDDLWNSIKEGVFTGFSLAGFFDSIQVKQSKEKTDEELVLELQEVVNDLEKAQLLYGIF